MELEQLQTPAPEETAPEEAGSVEILAQTWPEAPEEAGRLPGKAPLRPEWIMAIIACLAAALLITLVILCRPYFAAESANEDPESLQHYRDPATQPHPETVLEPTVAETEPARPTIPPDRNPYGKFDFQYNRHNYLLLQNVHSYPGVDVSAHQGVIDWDAVAKSGIKFAMIRLGYRGYESGKLVEDEYAQANLQGAMDAGLDVGAYFFSQALDIRETDEEIEFMLEILGERYLSMPIVLDWEIPAASARSNGMDPVTLTDIQRHFCGIMRDKGYQPMIYFNWHQSEHLYNLHDLEDYPFWLALYQDRMTYPWKVEMWQYTNSGKVPGINGPVDLNVYMPD